MSSATAVIYVPALKSVPEPVTDKPTVNLVFALARVIVVPLVISEPCVVAVKFPPSAAPVFKLETTL